MANTPNSSATSNVCSSTGHEFQLALLEIAVTALHTTANSRRCQRRKQSPALFCLLADSPPTTSYQRVALLYFGASYFNLCNSLKHFVRAE